MFPPKKVNKVIVSYKVYWTSIFMKISNKFQINFAHIGAQFNRLISIAIFKVSKLKNLSLGENSVMYIDRRDAHDSLNLGIPSLHCKHHPFGLGFPGKN